MKKIPLGYSTICAICVLIVALGLKVWLISLPDSHAIEDAVVKIQTARGHGSGFVVDGDGLIVTAAHVVGREPGRYFRPSEYTDLDAGDIIVVFPDGRELGAVSVYANYDTDVAILSVDPNGIALPTALQFGDANDLGIGDELVAIGNPFYETDWHAFGHVSREGKNEILFGSIDINPGHSGGPVLYNGKVVGMSRASYRATDISMFTSEEVIQPAIEIFKVLNGWE